MTEIQGEKRLYSQPREEKLRINALEAIILTVFAIQMLVFIATFLSGNPTLSKSSYNTINCYFFSITLPFFIPWWIDFGIPGLALFLNNKNITRNIDDVNEALILTAFAFVPSILLLAIFTLLIKAGKEIPFVLSVSVYFLIGLIKGIDDRRHGIDLKSSLKNAMLLLLYTSMIIGIVFGFGYGVIALVSILFQAIIMRPLLYFKKRGPREPETSYISKPPRIHE